MFFHHQRSLSNGNKCMIPYSHVYKPHPHFSVMNLEIITTHILAAQDFTCVKERLHSRHFGCR
jgi:hypothetical protein